MRLNLNKFFVTTGLAMSLSSLLFGTTLESSKVRNEDVKNANDKCITCHLKENRSLVDHYENSAHASADVGCYTCHATSKDDKLGYEHEGKFISTIQTPNDCKFCHEREVKEMTNSHHATAGQIMASLDNMFAEVIASFPNTKADAVNGCWQCHGTIVKPETDKHGNLIRNSAGAPVMDWMTWPNSGIGRINPDETKGSCNACHSRHDFSSSRARQPENCGKCHLGPDHPQKEVYEESKHGIAYYAAPKGDEKGGMNIHKQGAWVLGKDYNTAPTCVTCHMGSYKKSNGSIVPNTHNVGDRISWTLRPAISVKLNRVTFEDGTVQDIAGEKAPEVGSIQMTQDYEKKGDKLVATSKEKKVVKVIDGENLLIALNKTNLKVIAINKRFNQIDSNITKNLISKLIYEHSDPTVEVHEKIIYWIFDKNGNKLNETDIKEWKDSLKANNQQTLVDAVKGIETNNAKAKTDFNPYLTVKLSSDQILIENKFYLNKTSESNLSNIYILISSSQLINETVKK